jgi:hypothetical protein
MTLSHELVLYGLLALLALSLVGPGLSGVFRPAIGRSWLIAETRDASNHLRALNAMMAALGLVALWACWDLAAARPLVQTLGLVMAALVVARIYSLIVDARPGAMTMVYLGVEGLLAGVFLVWPPPVAA